ncbi:DUF226 domain-containing protein (plasmid) [Borreliella valaisiana]|uniref:DUF226 domain-containing protein n=1 Tax=Borreliella valaisiana TaxID=62088 RepID=UPI002738094C|nr:DUF226 domain-containing protein [Borreliella valaisiana]WLN25849.1 DUF226 domain-containing protein [Borreliella valaisiana]
MDFKVTNKEQRLRLVFQEFNKNIKIIIFLIFFHWKKNDKFLGIKYILSLCKVFPVFVIYYFSEFIFSFKTLNKIVINNIVMA